MKSQSLAVPGRHHSSENGGDGRCYGITHIELRMSSST